MSGTLLRSGAIVLAIVFSSTALAQSVTLREAVDEALSRNPAIESADAWQRTARARAAEARAARFPRIDVAEAVTRGNNPVFVFGTLLEQGRFAPRHFDPAFLNAPDPLTNHRLAVTARLAIFDRRTATAIGQARNGVQRAGIELEETRQQLRAQVVTAYYGVLVAEERVAVASDAVRTAEADEKATRDRFEQGLIVESDALAAGVHLAALRQRVIGAGGDLAIARAALAILLYRPPNEAIRVAGTLPAAPVDAIDLPEAITRANSRRGAVRNTVSNAHDAQLQLSAEHAALLPRVAAFGTIGASGASFANRSSTDHMAGLSVTVDLFDPARPARVAAARGAVDAARAAEMMTRDAVTLEVITAWNRLRAADATALVAATAVGQAEAAARIVGDRHAEGLVTITELLRARTALLNVRFDLLAARYARLTAHADLLRATGDLDDVHPFL